MRQSDFLSRPLVWFDVKAWALGDRISWQSHRSVAKIADAHVGAFQRG